MLEGSRMEVAPPQSTQQHARARCRRVLRPPTHSSFPFERSSAVVKVGFLFEWWWRRQPLMQRVCWQQWLATWLCSRRRRSRGRSRGRVGRRSCRRRRRRRRRCLLLLLLLRSKVCKEMRHRAKARLVASAGAARRASAAAGRIRRWGGGEARRRRRRAAGQRAPTRGDRAAAHPSIACVPHPHQCRRARALQRALPCACNGGFRAMSCRSGDRRTLRAER